MLNLEAETVITLKDGAVWLGMPEVASSDLYVRRCYIKLFQAREAYIKARGWEGMGPIIYYTGTPVSVGIPEATLLSAIAVMCA